MVLASPAVLLLARSELALSQPTYAHRGTFPTIQDRDFVPGGTRTVTMKVEAIAWGYPNSWLRGSDGLTSWNLMLPEPGMLVRLGIGRDSLPLGSRITVVLTIDASGTLSTDGALIGRVESILRAADQSPVFDRAVLPVSQR
jgi:hypothetical protein